MPWLIRSALPNDFSWACWPRKQRSTCKELTLCFPNHCCGVKTCLKEMLCRNWDIQGLVIRSQTGLVYVNTPVSHHRTSLLKSSRSFLRARQVLRSDSSRKICARSSEIWIVTLIWVTLTSPAITSWWTWIAQSHCLLASWSATCSITAMTVSGWGRSDQNGLQNWKLRTSVLAVSARKWKESYCHS